MSTPNLGWLSAAALGLIVLVVVIGVGAAISGEQRADEACDSGYVLNLTLTYPDQCAEEGTNGTCDGCAIEMTDTGQVYKEGLDGTDKFAGKFTLIASIVILVFVIGLLGMLYFKSR